MSAWGNLITAEKRASQALKELLLAIVKLILNLEFSNILLPTEPLLFAGRISYFYSTLGFNLDHILTIDGSTLHKLFVRLGIQHTLHCAPNKFDPTIPAMTPDGFITWTTLLIRMQPSDHSAVLMCALRKYGEHLKDGNNMHLQAKYGDLERKCFPRRPDDKLRAKVYKRSIPLGVNFETSREPFRRPSFDSFTSTSAGRPDSSDGWVVHFPSESDSSSDTEDADFPKTYQAIRRVPSEVSSEPINENDFRHRDKDSNRLKFSRIGRDVPLSYHYKLDRDSSVNESDLDSTADSFYHHHPTVKGALPRTLSSSNASNSESIDADRSAPTSPHFPLYPQKESSNQRDIRPLVEGSRRQSEKKERSRYPLNKPFSDADRDLIKNPSLLSDYMNGERHDAPTRSSESSYYHRRRRDRHYNCSHTRQRHGHHNQHETSHAQNESGPRPKIFRQQTATANFSAKVRIHTRKIDSDDGFDSEEEYRHRYRRDLGGDWE